MRIGNAPVRSSHKTHCSRFDPGDLCEDVFCSERGSDSPGVSLVSIGLRSDLMFEAGNSLRADGASLRERAGLYFPVSTIPARLNSSRNRSRNSRAAFL